MTFTTKHIILLFLPLFQHTFECDAFSVSSASLSQRSPSALNLLPSQGCQLAAAEASCKSQQESSLQTDIEKARKVIVDLFHLPSHQKSHEEQDDRNTVYHPIVGLTYVKVHDDDDNTDHVRILPSYSTPSCSIESHKSSCTLPVYGWFSPACFLGSIYDSDEDYCGKSLAFGPTTTNQD